jgi:hypothetical protein
VRGGGGAPATGPCFSQARTVGKASASGRVLGAGLTG